MSNKKSEEKNKVRGDGAFIEKLKNAFKEVTDLPDDKCINLIEGVRCKNPEDIPLDMERFHKFCSDTITQMTIVEGVSTAIPAEVIRDNSTKASSQFYLLRNRKL